MSENIRHQLEPTGQAGFAAPRCLSSYASPLRRILARQVVSWERRVRRTYRAWHVGPQDGEEDASP